MPILGFGVFQIRDEAECIQSVETALEVGYRSLDTAASYFNEHAVGAAIRNSGIAREELFVASKVWVDSAGEDAALRAFDASLSKLGLDYLDLYLIHQPYGDVYGSWRAMERLYKEGRIRAIGVSNFYPDRLIDLIMHNEIAPMVNQIETHPFFSRADYQPLMIEKGVQIESWAPFAEGKNDLFSNDVLTKIGEAHGKSVAQVVLRWLIQRDVVVIPKSVTASRIAENFDVFDFELSNHEMDAISALDTGASLFLDHRSVEATERIGGYKLS
ncbi:MAG: aldo/keto reductase [Actinomycetales bacterium]|nr:aldo/keto reductase [Actinomycetales bacterium]